MKLPLNLYRILEPHIVISWASIFELISSSIKVCCTSFSDQVFFLTFVKNLTNSQSSTWKTTKCSNNSDLSFFSPVNHWKKGKRKVQRVPQSQTAALPRSQEEEETNKRTESTKISSLFPKRGNRNTKRTKLESWGRGIRKVIVKCKLWHFEIITPLNECTGRLSRVSTRHKHNRCGMQKKVREKSRECHNHKPQPFPDPKRKRKRTNTRKALRLALSSPSEVIAILKRLN